VKSPIVAGVSTAAILWFNLCSTSLSEYRSVIVNHFGFNLWQICAAAATCIMGVGSSGGSETKEKFFFFFEKKMKERKKVGDYRER
jgi:hypothetical protein